MLKVGDRQPSVASNAVDGSLQRFDEIHCLRLAAIAGFTLGGNEGQLALEPGLDVQPAAGGVCAHSTHSQARGVKRPFWLASRDLAFTILRSTL